MLQVILSIEYTAGNWENWSVYFLHVTQKDMWRISATYPKTKTLVVCLAMIEPDAQRPGL